MRGRELLDPQYAEEFFVPQIGRDEKTMYSLGLEFDMNEDGTVRSYSRTDSTWAPQGSCGTTCQMSWMSWCCPTTSTGRGLWCARLMSGWGAESSNVDGSARYAESLVKLSRHSDWGSLYGQAGIRNQ